jgi:hypothetical protein
MAKSWPYLLLLGLAILFFAGAAYLWVSDPGISGDRPLPKDPALALRPHIEPADELALPFAIDDPEAVVVRQVTVAAGDGWRLDMHPDGTTRLGYGAADGWAVEPGVLDYLGTVQALRAVARKAGYPGSRHYRVTFRVVGVEKPIQGYTQDSRLALGLLDRAVGALQRPDARFDELWKSNPPFRIESK